MFIARRLVQSIIALFGVSLIVFGLMYLSGDPAALLVPPEAGQEAIDNIRRHYGLDQPFYVQYSRFLFNAVQGDFGTSFRHNQSALSLVLERIPATLELTAVAITFTLLIAIPVGIISAFYKNTIIDTVAMGLALLGQSIPLFWLGIMLILLVSVRMDLLPPGGRGDWTQLILPGLTLGAYSAGLVTRLTRSTMVEILAQDYIRTARAKGLSERLVLIRHAFKNAAIPIVTVLGLQIGYLMGGAVITETVFSYPGMGRLAIQAISNRDFPVVQAFVFVVAVTVLSINLLVDLIYGLLDPRIRME